MENYVKDHWSIEVNGVSYERAVELEGHEYPRFAAAYFHFDKLTPEEQRATIEVAKRELSEAEQEHKRVLIETRKGYEKIREEQAQGQFYGGQDSMLKPLYNQKRKDAKKRVLVAQQRLERLQRVAALGC